MNDPKDLVRRLFEEVFNERRFAVCDEIVADQYVEHAVPGFGRRAAGSVNGPEYIRELVTRLAAQHPDERWKIEAIIAEDETLSARVLWEGTNLGPLPGDRPPTGRKFSVLQMHWYRIRDNKLAEHWAVRDDLSMMLQLGVIPRPPR